MSKPREDELVARARQGDRQAFTGLVRMHQDRIFRFLVRMTGSRDEAMDLTQDTFTKAYHALPRWEPRASLSTWLFQIARNAAVDALRHRTLAAEEPLEDDSSLADPAAGPEAKFEARRRIERLETALGSLVPEHREVLLLREIEGLSYAEIAAALGVSEGTVKSRIARARAALLAKVGGLEEVFDD